jgi:multidrug efflux pump subunit AcrB
MFVDTFIQRPILASVCSLVIILAGAVASRHAGRAYRTSLRRRSA